MWLLCCSLKPFIDFVCVCVTRLLVLACTFCCYKLTTTFQLNILLFSVWKAVWLGWFSHMEGGTYAVADFYFTRSWERTKLIACDFIFVLCKLLVPWICILKSQTCILKCFISLLSIFLNGWTWRAPGTFSSFIPPFANKELKNLNLSHLSSVESF